MKIKKCPCCGQVVTDYIWLANGLFTLGAMQRRLVDVLRKAPDGIPVGRVKELLYSNDPNGGPETNNIIAVMAAQINRKMAKHGLRIRSRGGRFAIYSLEERCD